MTTHLLHGLWLKASGLHLWIEQVEGHKIVTADSVPEGTFPPQIMGILAGKRFNHRVRTTLLTPKGREVTLPLPTVAFAPEQAVSTLATIAAVTPMTATLEQRSSIAPDLVWLVRMYEGLAQFVRAGRVTIKMSFADHQWWPMWQLSSGLSERGWIAQMTAAAPGVLVANGGTAVAEDIADELPHWIAHSLLQGLAAEPRPTEWHNFSSALLHSTALRKGTAQLVSALNSWKDSIASVNLQIVFLVEEPPKEDDSVMDPIDILWPVRVQVRSGVDSPQPIVVSKFDRATVERLQALVREAIVVTPLLDPTREHTNSLQRYALQRAENAGDWDCYLSTDELVEFIGSAVSTLKSRGFAVMLPRAWSQQETKAHIAIGDPAESSTQAKIGLDKIVDYNWRISVGSVELSDEEMNELVRSKSGLIRLRGEWVMADTAAVKRISEYMSELAAQSRKRKRAELDHAMMVAQLAKANDQPGWQQLEAHAETLVERFNNEFADFGQVTLAELREIAIKAAEKEPVEFQGSTWHTSLVGGLVSQDIPAPQRIELPDTVHATLREYQRRGVDWLAWMSHNGLGAVLADDMGLGKTLQLLSLEAAERAEQSEGQRGPTLVVAPTSVVGNWAREAHKFVPSLRVLVHHGSSRLRDAAFLEKVQASDIVVTSYGTIARDHQLLSQIQWERVALDEAQQIKNSATKVSKAVRSMPSKHRIALTGTPVENRLSEMRSILDFCNPGVLGSASFFRNHFARAIEREQDEAMTERLRALTAPFVLRRLKTDPSIVDDLPEKTEIILTVDMKPEQAALYRAYVEDIQKQIDQAEGISKRGLVLSALTKIKQICNHPAHFLGDDSDVTVKGKHRSGKVEELMRLVSDAVESEQKLLIFTQYRVFGEILAPYLSDYFGTQIPFLHGGVSKIGRDRMVENFQSPEGPPAMILSLKAGGTGLNLTAASIVVHMDRWWNPAVENQATDRAFRIGQRKDVTVYKMITAGTLEESIQDILDGKTELASAVVGEGEGWLTELSPEELAMLMSYRGRDT